MRATVLGCVVTLCSVGAAQADAVADSTSCAGRARVRLALRDFDGATADYSEALRLAPETVSSHIGRGHAHFVRGDTAAAIADFTEAIRLNPQSASAYNRRGLAYRRSGHSSHAIDYYTAAITLNPIYALAYNNRGYVYEEQRCKDEAIADFKSALLLDPSLIGAGDGLRRLGVAESLLAQAEAHVQHGKSLVEKNCSPCHAVGLGDESPNRKAPPFRSLHARNPSLALREPLSRGIAAPHEEMPRFTLSGPEIGSIVAYINSMAPTTSMQPSSSVKAQPPTPVAPGGDAAHSTARQGRRVKRERQSDQACVVIRECRLAAYREPRGSVPPGRSGSAKARAPERR